MGTDASVIDLREQRLRGPAWLRRIFDHPHILPLTALLLRARTVRQSAAFVARELARGNGSFAYTVRGGTATVLVRHGTGDPVTLGEVFHDRDYEPPPEMPELRPHLIVDLGANVGYFGAFALERWPGASVLAYEPDPENAVIHAHAMALNDFAGRWQLRQAAAAASHGEFRFRASGDALSHASDEGELMVPAEDVLPLVARADLLKVDIEGGEWAILGDPRFVERPPRAVVLEYHPHPSAGPDPRATAIERLRSAGLAEIATIFRREDGYGMLWAWQP
jgi:FkbM family methyltransferase